MIRKDQAIPGTRVILRSILKDGVPSNMGGGETIPYVSVWIDRSTTGMELATIVEPGGELEIVKKPRGVKGVKLVRVRTPDRIEGEVYWCELYSNASPIKEG